jgi:hypothetical protein
LQRFRGLQGRTDCSITHLEIIHAAEQPLSTTDPKPPCRHAFFYFRAADCLPDPEALDELNELKAEERRAYRDTFFEKTPRLGERLAGLKASLRERFEGEDRVWEYCGTWDPRGEPRGRSTPGGSPGWRRWASGSRSI